MTHKPLDTQPTNKGVSAVVGVLILVVIVLLLSTGVYLTASTLTSDQPTDMTAGTTTERISIYEYQTNLVTSGNAQSVHVVSPLGTHYKLNQAGASAKILAVQYNQSRDGIGRLRIQGYNEESANSEAQLLDSQKVENGIQPDYIVAKDGTGDYQSIQTAINNAPPATESNPFIIVVERNTYTENIDVSQNITLIAEHGTVIQDANPNEPVIHVTGNNSKVQNFIVDGNPLKNDSHYASHGIQVGGANAEVIGNTVRNASSPDLNSAGLAVNGEYAFVQYNNFDGNERSLSLMQGSSAPVVCGNQFNSSIGGYASEDTKESLAMKNYWSDGVPTNLVPKDVRDNSTIESLTDESVLNAVSSKVPASMLPSSSRAGQPFPGTMLTSTSTSGCEVSISLVNTGGNFSVSDIKVNIEGNRTTTVTQQTSVTISGQQLANKRSKTTAVCDCGGDGEYNPGDAIKVYEPTVQNKKESSINTTLGSGEMYAQPLDLLDEGNPDPRDYSLTVPTGSGPPLGGGGPDLGQGGSVGSSSLSYSVQASVSSSTTKQVVKETEFTIELGTKITMTQGDKVSLSPVVNGASGDVSYHWTLGDNTTVNSRTVEHIYPKAGSYTVTLTATEVATGATDTDSTTVTVDRGSQDVKVISEQQSNELITGESGQTLYLTNGSYSQIQEIRTNDLTIVGRDDGVVFPNHVTVYSSGVSFRNVEFMNGVSVYNNDFKLYGSTVKNTDGYGVEVNADGSNIYLGSNDIQSQDGVYVNVDSGVDISSNTVTAGGPNGVSIGPRMSDVSITSNTISASKYGVYIGHATTYSANGNSISAPTRIYKVPNEPPVVEGVSADVTLANLPTSFNVDVSDPQGDRVPSVFWEIQGETVEKSPGENYVTTLTTVGNHSVEVMAKDSLGATAVSNEIFRFEGPTISLKSPQLVATGDTVKTTVETNIPSSRIYSVNYEWGDGTNTLTSALESRNEYSSTGNYSIRVTVETHSGYTISKVAPVNVTDSPVSDFYLGGDSNTLYVGESATFDGTYSTAPDNGELDYQWRINGETLTGSVVNYTFTDFGTYDVSLTVTDSGGFTETTTKQVEIGRVKTTVSVPEYVGAGKETTVSVQTSADGYGVIDEYWVDWNGDGYTDVVKQSSTFTHTFTGGGSETFTVDAVDVDTGAHSPVKATVTVKKPPEFSISANPTDADVEETVGFSVTQVSTSEADVKWNFGDGTVATGRTVNHKYRAPGSYTATATVYANQVNATKTVTIGVGGKLERGLVAHFPFNSVSNGESPNAVGSFNAELQGDATVSGNSITDSSALVCGANGEAVINDGDGISLGTGPYTVSLWMQSDSYSTDTGQIWSQREPNHELQVTNSEFSVISGDGLSHTASLDSTWHHMVITRTSDSLKMYVDGSLVNTQPASNANITDSSRYMLCNDPRLGDEHFDGSIDDFRVYDRALSLDEVNMMRNMTAGATATFTSPSATRANQAITFDASGSLGPGQLTYEWDLDGDGTTDETGAVVSKTYSTTGTRTVTLTVTTVAGNSDSITKDVSITSYTDAGEYYWYTYDYAELGHPTTSEAFDTLFDSSNAHVEYGGRGRWNSNIHWQSGGGWESKPSYLPEDGYAWKYEGYIYAPESGTYTIGINSDDGGDVIINGTTVTTYYGGHGLGYGMRTGTIELSQGYHKITVRQEEGGGGSGVSLHWKTPSATSTTVVPDEYLRGAPEGARPIQAVLEMSTQFPSTGDEVTFSATDSVAPASATYQWDFYNDGSVDAYGESISRTFNTTTGRIPVTLDISGVNEGNSDTVTRTVVITDTLPNGSYEWSTYDFNEMGHPRNAQGMAQLFDTTTKSVDVQGKGRFDGYISWSHSNGGKEAAPTYLPSESYAWKYEGAIYIPEDRTYRFGLSSDDGADLYIDGERLISRYSTSCDQNEVCSADSMTLEQGIHNITVRMENGGGPGGVALRWDYSTEPEGFQNSGGWTVVPDKYLRGYEAQPTQVDADYTFPEKFVKPGQSVTFDAEPSITPEGTTYNWDFNNDGQTDATGRTVSTSFSSMGVHPVTLTLNGRVGHGTDSVTKDVSVSNTLESGQYTWYTFDYLAYGKHPETGEEMDTLFDNTPTYATYEDRGRYNGAISWSNDNDGVHGKPSYLPSESYAWKYEGAIYAPHSGTYNFGLATDDGGDLYIDGKRVAYRYATSCDVGDEIACSGGTVTLDKGMHTITVRMEEGTGGDGVALHWKYNTEYQNFDVSTTGWRLVPDKYLRGYDTQPLSLDATFTASPKQTQPGNSITFDASGTVSPEGESVTYKWDLNNDGAIDTTGKTVTTSYSEGDYTVVLHATTGSETETVTRTVSVHDYTETGTYMWFTDNGGHPDSKSEMDADFNNETATYGGSGSWDKEVNWHSSSSKWGSKPTYLPADQYTWKYDGYIYIPETGTYTFGVDSDDASDIVIDGEVAASWYGGHGANSYHSGTLQLEKGYHRIKIRMEEGTGGDGISAVWMKPGQDSWQAIPKGALYGR